MNHIAIVWDFDGTLTPLDSTTKTIEILQAGTKGEEFWSYIKSLRGDAKKPDWEHVLASDAPIWMYALSRIAAEKRVPLNKEFFKDFVIPEIKLFPGSLEFLQAIKNLSKLPRFKKAGLEKHGAFL